MTASPDSTTLVPNFITDSTGGQWSLTPSLSSGAQICLNGSIQSITANVVILLYYNQIIYQENTAGHWYAWSHANSSWSMISGDPRSGTATSITGITLSNSSFAGGSASGAVVGKIAVTMSSGSFTGTLSLSGTDVSSFQISGSNLETNGVVPAGSYSVNIVATQTGATGSPFSHTFPLSGTSVAAPAITGMTLSNSSFTGGAPSGTVVGTVAVTMSSGIFSGTLALSGTNASSFSLVGNNLVTNGVVNAGSYSVVVTATEAGATGSPFAHTFGITATGGSTSATPPSQASSAGFSNLVFNDDFTTNSIATSANATAGFNWYWAPQVGSYITSASWSVNTGQMASQMSAISAGNNASAHGGILTLDSVRGGSSGFWGNSTLISVPRGLTHVPTQGCWQHGYFEAYIGYNPDALGSNHPYQNGFPAFWAWGVEGIRSYGDGGSSMGAGVTEVDFFEDYSGVNWGSGTNSVGTNVGHVVNPAGNGVYGSQSNYPTSTAKWTTIGCLWTKGEVKFYKDNVLYGSGVNTSSIPLENTHLFLILGTGIGWPMYVDWVRVWQ